MRTRADLRNERLCKQPNVKSRIAIIADTLSVPWGGSEELWAQTATRLVAKGVSVAASIHGGLPIHQRVRDLLGSGVKLRLRPERYSVWGRMRRRMISGRNSDVLLAIEEFINAVQPELVLLSTGWIVPPIDWLELCCEKALPFVTVGQMNSECWWFEDEIADRYRKALGSALQCFFVSRANLELAEKQIGSDLPNAEVVCNPFNVNVNSSLPWPPLDEDGELRLASVARLDPRAKGQDILLEVLADKVWLESALAAHAIRKRSNEKRH